MTDTIAKLLIPEIVEHFRTDIADDLADHVLPRVVEHFNAKENSVQLYKIKRGDNLVVQLPEDTDEHSAELVRDYLTKKVGEGNFIIIFADNLSLLKIA